MKNMMKTCLLLMPLVLLTGCYTTGLSSRDPGGRGYDRMVYGYMNRQSPEANADTPAEIELPVRLAVAQAGELAPPSELTEGLQAYPDTVRRVIPLSLPAETGPHYGRRESEESIEKRFSRRVDTLLRLARDQRADQLMILGGRVESRSVKSPLEIVNLLILPCFIVPTQKVEVDAHAAALVLDVKTGGVLATLGASTSASAFRPAAYARQAHTTLAKEQKPQLAEDLAREYVHAIRNR